MRWLLVWSLILISCSNSTDRLIIELPSASACAALCVSALNLTVLADGQTVDQRDEIACGAPGVHLSLPPETRDVRIELIGVDRQALPRANASVHVRHGDAISVTLTPLPDSPACSVADGDQSVDAGPPADATVDAGSPADATVDAVFPSFDTIEDAPLDDDDAIFVAADFGDDQASGTMAAPVKTFSKAHALAVQQGKVIVMTQGSYRAVERLMVSVYGNYAVQDGVWHQLPYGPEMLRTVIIGDEAIVIGADTTLVGLKVFGRHGECALVLSDPYRLQMHWVSIFGRPHAGMSGLAGCAIRQDAGHIQAEFVSFRDFEGETRPESGPFRAPVRIYGGAFAATNLFALSHYQRTPAIEVHGTARLHIHGVLMVGAFGVAAYGGETEIAQVTFDVRQAALLMPQGERGAVRIVNALMKVEHAEGAVVGRIDGSQVELSLHSALLDEASTQCWSRPVGSPCQHTTSAELLDCTANWCAELSHLRRDFVDLDRELRQRPGSQGIGTGIDITPYFNGPRGLADLYGVPWPIHNPDLGWLQTP